MSKIFFIFFIACEILIIVIYSIIVCLRNKKYHYLSTIEQQGLLATSTVKKTDAFKMCVWSVSKKKYIEYVVNVNSEKKIIYTKSDKIIDEKLSRDRYFDLRVGEFVNANYNQPYYNKKFNYCYGRTYIRNGEDNTITEANDDSNIDIDRVFITYIRKNGDNIYEIDLEKQQLVNVVKSAFPLNPEDNECIHWNIIRYYEYLNKGNKNTVLPNENKSDITVQNNTIYFKFNAQKENWQLETCPSNTLFNGIQCDDTKLKFNKLTPTPKTVGNASNLIKKTNIYSNLEDEENKNILNHQYKSIDLLNSNLLLVDADGKKTYILKIDTGYDAIDFNFNISLASNTTEYVIRRSNIAQLIRMSSEFPERIFHLDDRPDNYILAGNFIKNHTPVIIYKNKPYFSNPILFEILSNIKQTYANSNSILNPDSYPRMRYIKYLDSNGEYSNLIDNILAIIGMYGDGVVGDVLIAKNVFEKLLGENIQINQFTEYFSRKFYYECSWDLYGTIELTYVHANIKDVVEKYVFLNVFDLYDNFDHSYLKKISII